MISLKVKTPEQNIFEGECRKLQIKSLAGSLTILPKHTPLVTVISSGYIKIDEQDPINITSALVTVNENSIVDIIVSKK